MRRNTLYGLASQSIINDATHNLKTRNAEDFRAYLNDLWIPYSNHLLDHLPEVNWLPKSVFIRRFAAIRPYVRQEIPFNTLFEEQLAILQDRDEVVTLSKVTACQVLVGLAAADDSNPILCEWLKDNSYALNQAFAKCIRLENSEATQEVCIAIAFLVRTYNFYLRDNLSVVLHALIRLIALAMSPWDEYIELYRAAKDRHLDNEIVTGVTHVFHFKHPQFHFTELHYTLVAHAYYTLADLLYNCPMPKLIHEFMIRIFRRKEMTRSILFKILHSVVSKLPQIQSQAEVLTKALPAEIREIIEVKDPLEMSGQTVSWSRLPAIIYLDILRALNERNKEIRSRIMDIMTMTRAQSHEDLPVFDDSTLKAMMLYSGTDVPKIPGFGRHFKDSASTEIVQNTKEKLPKFSKSIQLNEGWHQSSVTSSNDVRDLKGEHRKVDQTASDSESLGIKKIKRKSALLPILSELLPKL